MQAASQRPGENIGIGEPRLVVLRVDQASLHRLSHEAEKDYTSSTRLGSCQCLRGNLLKPSTL